MNRNDEPEHLDEDDRRTDENDGRSERLRTYDYYAALRLNDLIDRNGTLPTRVNAVKVLGSPNTRNGFIRQIINPVLAPESSLSLKSALDRLAIIAENLAKFGIYDSVSVQVDQSPESSAEQQDIDATIRLKERPRLWARTGTDLGNQEGSAYATVSMRNVFGGAESLEGNMSFGTRTKTSYELRFTTPIKADPNTILDVLGFRTTRNNPYAGHDENTQGAIIRLRRLGDVNTQELSLSAVNRQVANLLEGASLAMRQCAGVSRKISILHTITQDTRDDTILPSSGHRLKMSTELAGAETFGGDTSFLKINVDASKHISLTSDSRTALHMSTKSGLLWAFNNDGKTYLPDRFQLGGPQSVRGFMHNGLGPRSDRESLGGDIFLAAAMSLTTPLPRAPETWPLRFQVFANSGSLLNLNRANTAASIRQLITEPSISAGFGLIFKHPVARAEMSFGLPIVARSSDRTRKGLQFGLGVEFL